MKVINKSKGLAFLAENAGSFCDDCITKGTGIPHRQTVYQICNAMTADGLISRSYGKCNGCDRYKKVNQLLDARPPRPIEKTSLPAQETTDSQAKPWYWEGNVQSKLISWLANEGYKIRSVADTAARSRGVDIIAEDKDGGTLWITVKGYPNSESHTQARHYFSSAIFDLILYRGQSSSALIAIGLPAGFSTYENLAQKVEWIRQKLFPFDIYWIDETGHITKK